MSEVWYPNENKKWNALDPSDIHPAFSNPTVIDSADVQITTTDTQAALSIQATLQAAIVVILSISIADSAQADKVAQELFQKSGIKQANKQWTVIRNSRNVTVTTTDTDIAVNIQILIQLLLALLAKLDTL